MRVRFLMLALVAASVFGVLASDLAAPPAAAAQQIDTEVPPGNPVIGSDRPGDVEAGNDTNYGLWSLVAVCLIGAGVLLVTIERWEGRRIAQAEQASRT